VVSRASSREAVFGLPAKTVICSCKVMGKLRQNPSLEAGNPISRVGKDARFSFLTHLGSVRFRAGNGKSEKLSETPMNAKKRLIICSVAIFVQIALFFHRPCRRNRRWLGPKWLVSKQQMGAPCRGFKPLPPAVISPTTGQGSIGFSLALRLDGTITFWGNQCRSTEPFSHAHQQLLRGHRCG